MLINCIRAGCDGKYDKDSDEHCPVCGLANPHLDAAPPANNPQAGHPPSAQSAPVNQPTDDSAGATPVPWKEAFEKMQKMKNDGFHFIMLVGFSNSGKSFFLERIKALSNLLKANFQIAESVIVLRTDSKTLYPLEFRRYKKSGKPSYVFIDISGENLQEALNRNGAQFNALVDNQLTLAALYYADAAIFFAPVVDLAITDPKGLAKHRLDVKNLFSGFQQALSDYEHIKQKYPDLDEFIVAVKNHTPGIYLDQAKLPLFVNITGVSRLGNDPSKQENKGKSDQELYTLALTPEKFAMDSFKLDVINGFSNYAFGFTDVCWKLFESKEFDSAKPSYGVSDLFRWLDYQTAQRQLKSKQPTFIFSYLRNLRQPSTTISWILRWGVITLLMSVFLGTVWSIYQDQTLSAWINNPHLEKLGRDFSIGDMNLAPVDQNEIERFDNALWQGQLQRALIAKTFPGFIAPDIFHGRNAYVLDWGGATTTLKKAVKRARDCGENPNDHCDKQRQQVLAEEILQAAQVNLPAKRMNNYLRGMAYLWLENYVEAFTELQNFLEDNLTRDLGRGAEENQKAILSVRVAKDFAEYRQHLEDNALQGRALGQVLDRYAKALDEDMQVGQKLFGGEFNQVESLQGYGLTPLNIRFDQAWAQYGAAKLFGHKPAPPKAMEIRDSRLELLECTLQFRDIHKPLEKACLEKLYNGLNPAPPSIILRRHLADGEWPKAMRFIESHHSDGQAPWLESAAGCLAGRQADYDLSNHTQFLPPKERIVREPLLGECSVNRWTILRTLHGTHLLTTLAMLVVPLIFAGLWRLWVWKWIIEAEFVFISRFRPDTE